MNQPGSSARVRLLKTRRGTWVDESLFPEARREGLDLIMQAARDSGDEGIVKMLQGHTKLLSDSPLGDRIRSRQFAPWRYGWPLSRWEIDRVALELLAEKIRDDDLPEEREARWLAAFEAPKAAEKCGCCARSLGAGDTLYFGAEVYVGFQVLRMDPMFRPRVCQPRYQRTVLCEACAPEWLLADSEGVVTQLCGHCERPMVYQLTPSALGRTFCSDPCGRAYHNQVRKERRAEERKKICKVCGGEFTAARKDAKTCSAGCKQKAYRQRNKETTQN